MRFETYRPSDDHPSQHDALLAMSDFASGVGTAARGRRERRLPWSRQRPRDVAVPGRYLDGGYGVGKTHLLAACWHAVDVPASYLTFEELTAVIGFLGMSSAVDAFSRYRLVCIDEFELDDVANTLMAVSFLRAVMGRGVSVAATSNTLPDRLGEGRFHADDFRREIAAIADHFEVVRIDGPDYRRRSGVVAPTLGDAQLDVLAREAAGCVALDDFDALLAHLRRVHPVQLGPMLDGLDGVLIRGLRPITDQGDALLFVQLVDELYDAELRVAASGCPVDELFPATYRHGGYRKKYGRCESRLSALLAEAASG